MKKLLFIILLIPLICTAQKPAQVTIPYNFTKYVLIKNDTVWSKSKILSWVPQLSINNWDTAYNRSHRHNNLPLLQSIKASDTARWGSSGQTINDGMLHWNGTSYVAYPDSTGTGVKNAIYLGNQDPTSQTRINWNGVLHPSGLWVQALTGTSFLGVNSEGIGIQASTISGNGILATSINGTAGVFSSTTGKGISTSSSSGVPLIANNGPGNTSDIFKLQLNNSNKATFDYNGVYSLSGIYKMPSTAGSPGQYLTSSGTGNQMTWSSAAPTNNNLLYWNSSLGSYTAYSGLPIDTSFKFYFTKYNSSIIPSAYSNNGTLVVNSGLSAGSIYSGYSRTGVAGFSNLGYGVLGQSSGGIAVYGQSIDAPALYGLSDNNLGGYFESGTGISLLAKGHTSIIAEFDSSSLAKAKIDISGNFLISKNHVGTITDTLITKKEARSLSGLGFANPMTSSGDLIVGGTSGIATRKAIGSTGQVLTVSGGTPIWANHWEPQNNLLYWNSSASKYTPFSSVPDTSLILFRNSGVVSSQNALGYLGVNGQLIAGSQHSSNNRTAIYGVSYSGAGVYGSSITGYGLQAQSNNTALYSLSASGVSAIFNINSGNTSDIIQAKSGGNTKFRVDYNGSAYKSTTDTFALKSDIRAMALLKSDTISADSLLHNTILTGVPTAPTAVRNTATQQIATTQFVTANELNFNQLKAIGFPGSLLPAFWTFQSSPPTQTMVSSRVGFSLFIPRETKTYRYINVYVSTPGVYIANGATGVNGVCVYSCAGATWSKITNTETIDTTIWKTNGLKQITLTTPVTLMAGTLYRIAYSYSSSSATTTPVLQCFSSTPSINLFSTTAYEYPQATITTQTSFSTSYTNSSTSSYPNVVDIYFVE